jgi:hypothetical protein
MSATKRRSLRYTTASDLALEKLLDAVTEAPYRAAPAPLARNTLEFPTGSGEQAGYADRTVSSNRLETLLRGRAAFTDRWLPCGDEKGLAVAKLVSAEPPARPSPRMTRM